MLAAPDLVAPAFLTHPDYTSSAGAEAADLAASLVLPDGSPFAPDAEQRLLLDLIYAETAPGASFSAESPKWAAFEVAVIAARQNIKTSTYEMSCVSDLWLFGARLVIWTAHLFNPAAAESFLHIKQLIEANAFLSRRVKRIHEAAGHEGIELMDGARLKFLARSKNSGRSLSADVLIVDEAYKLTSGEMGATLPTLTARPNAQVRYGSSAAHFDSEALLALIDRGRVGDDSLVFAEWCSTGRCVRTDCSHERGALGCVADDVEQRRAANPTLDKRISRQTLDKLRMALTPPEFMREVMGRHDDPRTGGRVIPLDHWASLARDTAIDGPVALAVDVTLDRAKATVWLCGANVDGLPQLECADTRPGTSWVADRVADLIESHDVLAVGARSAGPVASLLPDLAGVCEDTDSTFVKVGSGESAGMCGLFYDAAMSSRLVHRADPRLTDALKAAKKHKVVDAWSWERVGVDTDAAPLVAATGAYALFVQHSRRAEYDPLDNLW